MGWQRCWFLPVFVLLCTTRAALAGVLPVGASASLVVDGRTFAVPVSSDTDPRTGKTIYFIDNVSLGSPADGFSAMLSGESDPDPMVGYAIAVTDFAAPSSFAFTFTSPIVPTGPPTSVRAQVGGGLNNADGVGGVTITPLLADLDGDGTLEIQTSSVSSGGPFVNMGVDVGPAKTGTAIGAGPGNEYESAPGVAHSAGPTGGPVGPWTALSVTAAFSLSGGGDSTALTGFAEVVIPEPSSVILAVIGSLFGCFLLFRRRSK